MDLPDDASQLRDLEISRVDVADRLAQFVHAFTVATGSDPLSELGFLRLLTATGYGESDQWGHYVGALDGRVVATASAFTGAGVAGIYLVATLPTERRRGIATTLVGHVLQQARLTGYTIGTLQASKVAWACTELLDFANIAASPSTPDIHG